MGEEVDVMRRFGQCCGMATFRSGGTIESTSGMSSGISTSLSPTLVTFSRKILSNFMTLGENVIWEGSRP